MMTKPIPHRHIYKYFVIVFHNSYYLIVIQYNKHISIFQDYTIFIWSSSFLLHFIIYYFFIDWPCQPVYFSLVCYVPYYNYVHMLVFKMYSKHFDQVVLYSVFIFTSYGERSPLVFVHTLVLLEVVVGFLSWSQRGSHFTKSVVRGGCWILRGWEDRQM